MTNVLIINTCGLGVGGITSHMINYSEVLPKDIKLSIVVTGIYEQSVIDLFVKRGFNIIFLPNRKKNPVRYMLALSNILKKEKYDVIHVHGNSATMVIELGLAKKNKIKTRIAHCHNSQCDHPKLNLILSPYFKMLYTDALACSDLAGEWIFGRGNYRVLHNAIDLDKYFFSDEVRNKYRKELKIDKDTVVIGHVGNINGQKNHKFLIKLFYEFQKNNKAMLLLIGADNFKTEMLELTNLIADLNISDKIKLLGLRNDVPNLLCAMDIFVFPSLFEGLGMVAVEAQANGLPVLASDAVPQEVRLSDKIEYLSLNEPMDVWCTCICDLLAKSTDRTIKKEDFRNYDINSERKYLFDIYNKQ